METIEHCKFKDAEGICQNPELNTEGSKCCNCEDFVSKRIDQSCRDCKYFDPENDGGYCYHYSVPQSAIGHPCKYFEQGVCVTKRKSKPKAKKETNGCGARVNDIDFPGSIKIPVSELEPHVDAATHPRSEGDNEAVSTTIDEGLHEPLSVMRKEDGDGWWVVDGCSRLAAALEHGLEELSCMEVTGVHDARRFALIKNGMRRRVSTGTRVLSYVNIHYATIMAAAPSVSHDSDTGKIRRETPKGMEQWQVAAIAKRLRTSNKDVIAALLLEKCLREGRKPECLDGKQAVGEEADQEEMEKLNDTYNSVLSGQTPVRRWAGGYQSTLKTKGKPRPKTDYPEHAKDTFIRLGTVFEGWMTISGANRDDLLYKILAPRLEHMPDEVRAFLIAFLEQEVRK